MRFRAVAGALVAGAVLAGSALALAVAVPALAETPVDLGGSPVQDEAGALTDQAAARAAIDAAFERTGVSLFAVVVKTFDNPSDADDWAYAVATRNNLGVNDVLLVIAVEDRAYTWSADSATLTDGQIDAMSARVESYLRDGDWDGAVVDAANALADQLDPPFPAVPVAIGAGVVVLGGLTAGGIAIGRRRRENAATRASVKELDTQAGSLLVQLDDAVKTSEQELGFAVAQFGEESTAVFATALAEAKTQLKEAFAIRHRLDDVEREPAWERRDLTMKIIELCEAADATLDAQAEAFEQLRELERNAPQLVEQLAAGQQALATRIDAAETTIDGLRTRFGVAGVDAIDENPAQARKLASFVSTRLGTARDELARGEGGAAAIAVRAAQQASGQIVQLLDAIDQLALDLPELDARLTAATADTRADIAEARAVPGTAGALDGVIGEAERVLAAVKSQDLALALAAVEQTNAALNSELSAVRDRQAQVARAVAQLDRVTAEARSGVAAATDYLTTRRGALGWTARTRMAEAEAQLAQAVALGATDPVAALAAAQQASQLASSALSQARSEVAAYDRPARRYDDSGSGYGEDTGGALLGGILDALFSGSGSSSGWSGGGSRRSSGSSSRRRSSGSSRRSSSSSGRRSRGGRF